jgi:hypothetical protein
VTGRRAHLVGSIPGKNAAEAMRLAVDRLGPELPCLPDGETGDRRNWVLSMIEEFRANPDVRLVKDGTWSDYDDMPRFGVRPGHRLDAKSINLGIAPAAMRAKPEFDELRQELASGARFQVGIPSDLDLALFTFGPAGPLRHRRPFTEALAATMREVHGSYADNVVFQIEVPAELVFVAKTPGPARSAIAVPLSRGIVALARSAPPGARFGIHLCLGDFHHRALAKLTDASAITVLANAIASRWPQGWPLEYVHLPLAAAEDPPATEAAFYAPLAGLRLPPGTRLVAGFAHEGQDLATQIKIRQYIEDAVGHPVDISTSCGLGRRDPEIARAAIDRIKVLLSS